MKKLLATLALGVSTLCIPLSSFGQWNTNVGTNVISGQAFKTNAPGTNATGSYTFNGLKPGTNSTPSYTFNALKPGTNATATYSFLTNTFGTNATGTYAFKTNGPGTNVFTAGSGFRTNAPGTNTASGSGFNTNVPGSGRFMAVIATNYTVGGQGSAIGTLNGTYSWDASQPGKTVTYGFASGYAISAGLTNGSGFTLLFLPTVGGWDFYNGQNLYLFAGTTNNPVGTYTLLSGANPVPTVTAVLVTNLVPRF